MALRHLRLRLLRVRQGHLPRELRPGRVSEALLDGLQHFLPIVLSGGEELDQRPPGSHGTQHRHRARHEDPTPKRELVVKVTKQADGDQRGGGADGQQHAARVGAKGHAQQQTLHHRHLHVQAFGRQQRLQRGQDHDGPGAQHGAGGHGAEHNHQKERLAFQAPAPQQQRGERVQGAALGEDGVDHQTPQNQEGGLVEEASQQQRGGGHHGPCIPKDRADRAHHRDEERHTEEWHHLEEAQRQHPHHDQRAARLRLQAKGPHADWEEHSH
mmetsp:Transcript_50879/g.121679  ORF Transcript_50879/g.121679 Transcript_50879/m.121679 type:complete len:270 (-) Transcript_50879:131-940(-)